MSKVKRDWLGKRESSQLPYKPHVLALSVFFIHILVYTYFTEGSQPTCPPAVVVWFFSSFCFFLFILLTTASPDDRFLLPGCSIQKLSALEFGKKVNKYHD